MVKQIQYEEVRLMTPPVRKPPAPTADPRPRSLSSKRTGSSLMGHLSCILKCCEGPACGCAALCADRGRVAPQHGSLDALPHCRHAFPKGDEGSLQWRHDDPSSRTPFADGAAHHKGELLALDPRQGL